MRIVRVADNRREEMISRIIFSANRRAGKVLHTRKCKSRTHLENAPEHSFSLTNVVSPEITNFHFLSRRIVNNPQDISSESAAERDDTR